jgi:hypothetical protein
MMKKQLKIIFGEHKILALFSFFSIFLLTIFLTLQYFQFSGLKLDIKWLIISGIPILLGLFIGEYIKSFKGFGIEIETSLKSELPTKLVSPISENTIVDSKGINKNSLGYLLNLDPTERKKMSRIRFVFNRQGYYDFHVVSEYFRALNNLKYVEVVDENNVFKFLIPIGTFKIQGDISTSKIEDFLNQIENQTLSANFPSAITSYVNHDDSLLDAYRKLTSKNEKLESVYDKKLPVLNSDNNLIGLLSKIKVEEFISKEVLNRYDQKYGR